MRKFLSTIAAAGALTLAAVAATPAAAIDFVGGYTTNFHDSNNGGLNIGVTDNGVGTLNFDLDAVFPWDHQIVDLFDVWADESINPLAWGSDQDTIAKQIKINFTFTSPVTSGNVHGWTDGHLNLFGPDYGTVTWNNLGLQTFNFGDTGVLKVLVFNEDLVGTFGKGAQNGVTVKAKFWMESMPSAVPEPATWAMMITGFGLAGVALRRRRSLGAVAA